MKKFRSVFLAAAACTVALGVAPSTAQTTGQPTVPIEVWALRDTMTTVQVSPSGERLLVIKNESRDGDYLMELYDTDNLGGKPYRIAADPMEIIGAQWVSDDFIFGTAWQQNRSKVNGPEEGTYDYASFIFDVNKKKFQRVEGVFSIATLLPDEPNEILIGTGRSVPGSTTTNRSPAGIHALVWVAGGRVSVCIGTIQMPGTNSIRSRPSVRAHTTS